MRCYRHALLQACAVTGMRFQTGKGFLLQAIFTIWPDLVPIQTDAPA